MPAGQAARSSPPEAADRLVVLFDGVCHLCSGSVRFLAARDPRRRLLFAPLQSDIGRELLGSCGAAARADLWSLVVIDSGRCLTRSDAVLRLMRELSGAWPALSLFRIVPRKLRDWCYDRVAGNRYRWFGREEICMVPDPGLRERFLG